MTERKDVNIYAVPARAGVRAPFPFSARGLGEAVLFDPERPTVGPNELLKEQGGMVDPRFINHNCPFCHKTMSWALFGAHMKDTKEGPGCFRRWFHTMDVTKRRFPGASIGDNDE